MTENIVRIDRYTNNPNRSDQVIVFVNGYALIERSFNAANNVAKAIGQKEIKVTVYGYSKPYDVNVKVY